MTLMAVNMKLCQQTTFLRCSDHSRDHGIMCQQATTQLLSRMVNNELDSSLSKIC